MSMVVRPPSVSPAHQRRLKRTLTRLLDRAHERAEKVAIGLHRTIITENGQVAPAVIPDLAGDVTGQITANLVSKLAGTPLSSIVPVDGQVLVYDGTQWIPGAPGDPTGQVIDYSSLVNQALVPSGASATASSYSPFPETVPESAIDGDDVTAWWTVQPAAGVAGAAGAWLQIDLGSAETITWIRILQYQNPQYRATSSKLQHSTSAAGPWTDELTFGIFSDSGLTELSAPVSRRYWRVLGISGPAGYPWGLSTVALYSGQPTVQAPGHIIEDEGTPLAQRNTLNFVGAGVTVTDDSGNEKTLVTIPSTAVTVQEVDGSPTETPTTTLQFPNGTLTEPSAGVVRYTPTAASSSTRWELVVDQQAGELIWAGAAGSYDLIYAEVPV
jgi:hypothetical protein